MFLTPLFAEFVNILSRSGLHEASYCFHAPQLFFSRTQRINQWKQPLPVVFWFLQQYWRLIKTEWCFPTLCSFADHSPLCLSQHQLGSIRSPDNRRWHMPAFISKHAVAASLILVCTQWFVCGDREGRSYRPLFFFLFFLWLGVCKAYAQLSVWKRGTLSPNAVFQLICY